MVNLYRDYTRMTNQQLCALLKLPQVPADVDRSQLIREAMARDTVRHFVFGAFCMAAVLTLGWIVHTVSK